MLDVMFTTGHTEENELWSSLAVEELMAQSVLPDLSVYVVPSNNYPITFVFNNQTQIQVKSKPSAILG